MIDDLLEKKILPQYITFAEFECPDVGGKFCSELCKDAILGLGWYTLEKTFRGDAYVD